VDARFHGLDVGALHPLLIMRCLKKAQAPIQQSHGQDVLNIAVGHMVIVDRLGSSFRQADNNLDDIGGSNLVPFD
jgi:hypothetical protein